MELITGIELQPEFPKEDLSENNALLLELLLANQPMLQAAHTAIKEVSWISRVGHPTINRCANNLYEDSTQEEAIDHGIVGYEAIHSLVVPTIERVHSFATERQSIRLLRDFDIEELRNHALDTADDFTNTLPRTSVTIERMSKRFIGNMTHYALLGAALARRFELDCLATPVMR